MFAQSLRVGCRRAFRRGIQANAFSQRITRRRYSNASPTPTTVSNASSPVAALGGLTNELDRLSPRFDIDASQITILKDPSEFFETLKASGIFRYYSHAMSPFKKEKMERVDVFECRPHSHT